MTREEVIVSRDCFKYIADEIEFQVEDKLKLLWRDLPEEKYRELKRQIDALCEVLRTEADIMTRGLDMKGG